MLKASFKNDEHLTEFWLQSTINRIHHGLWIVVHKLLIAFISFISFYLVEREFSAVTDLKPKRVTDLITRNVIISPIVVFVVTTDWTLTNLPFVDDNKSKFLVTQRTQQLAQIIDNPLKLKKKKPRFRYCLLHYNN